jgi:hypothetical protein
MPVFVHITPSRNLPAIRRSGITQPPRHRGNHSAVFALPVTPNFYLSHQWLREIQRWKPGGPLVAVYFRLPDDELLYIGHYGHPHLQTTAAHATALMWPTAPRENTPRDPTPRTLRHKYNENPDSREGYQVVLSRGIRPHEILRVKPLRQVIGWRYKPRAHHNPPFVCACCCRGRRGTRTLLARRATAPPDGPPFAPNNAKFRKRQRRIPNALTLEQYEDYASKS